MFSARPLFGIGFNNLELMKGTQSNIPDNSLFGYDSSVLTILITSGIAGTCGYLLFMWYLFMKSENRFQKILVLSFLFTHFQLIAFLPRQYLCTLYFYIICKTPTRPRPSSPIRGGEEGFILHT